MTEIRLLAEAADFVHTNGTTRKAGSCTSSAWAGVIDQVAGAVETGLAEAK